MEIDDQWDFEEHYPEVVRIEPGLRTSRTEIIHILIAWLAISYAFAILLLWFKFGGKPITNELFSDFTNPFFISLSTVGFSFLVHEISHKIIAQRYGSWAEFRMSPFMLLMMVYLVHEFGILFAAPGAVMIFGGSVGKRENGLISLAGPLSNIFLVFVFFLMLSRTGTLYEIGRYGVLINIALALFNMLPFGAFDGRKIWAWNKPVYLAVTLTGLLLLIRFVPRLIT